MTIDAQGNIHDRTGQFAQKQNSAPAGGLAAPARSADDELADNWRNELVERGTIDMFGMASDVPQSELLRSAFLQGIAAARAQAPRNQPTSVHASLADALRDRGAETAADYVEDNEDEVWATIGPLLDRFEEEHPEEDDEGEETADPRVTEAFDELGGGEARYIHDVRGLAGRHIGIESVYPRFEGPHASERIVVRIHRNAGGIEREETFPSRAFAEVHVRELITAAGRGEYSPSAPAQV